jgi:RNA polymerase sigma-70 factor (ECF subfamily)
MTSNQHRTDAATDLSANPKDFSDFIRDAAPELLNYFRRRVVPADSAADCLGEVLLTLWRKRDEFPAESEQRPWAFGIAHNVLRNHLRSQRRGFALSQRLGAVLLSMTDQEMTRQSANVLEALAELKPEDRELVLLVAWEGFNLNQAASILGIQPATARARYSRNRARLASLIHG